MANILEKVASGGNTHVSLVTTAETALVTTPGVVVPFPTAKILIKGWAQLAFGTNATGVNVRIYRGISIFGTLIQESNTEQMGAAVNNAGDYSLKVFDVVAGMDGLQYTLSVQQVAATGNGTAEQYSLEVEVLPG
jgi:hypothetical protein